MMLAAALLAVVAAKAALPDPPPPVADPPPPFARMREGGSGAASPELQEARGHVRLSLERQDSLRRSPPAPPRADARRGEGDRRDGASRLSDARWVAPDTDLVAFLSQTPGECLAKPLGDPSLVEAGRALFRSALTLGGPAARYGLSCNSCHRDGRDNPHFFLEGLSGAPGTADVTSALFSKTREDGAFNPKPIPDLAGGGFRDLEGFIRSAVADEFQGAAPEAVVGALAAYVAALTPEACTGPEPQTIARAISDLGRALAATDAALARGDRAAADSLFLAMLQDLNRIDERHAPLPALSALIRARGAELTAAREEADRSPKKGRKALKRFAARVADLEAVLSPAAGDSLYDKEALSSRLTSHINR
ncbi:MAG: hypothetical protein NW204_07185 [Xanthomonadaceae bacterium]|nr:hypothetical protein [Xanthomonadaceae bacterium]